MKSAADKFASLLPSQLGLGPHSARLITEAQIALRHRLWASVIILAATIVDTIRQEDQIFDISDYQGADDDGDDEYDYDAAGYFAAGGYDYLTAAERKKLEWLRECRNQIIHYEGPVEGMMGRTADDGLLAQQADKALSAIMPIMEQD